jgi:DNA (cytosine-5)-methyltransferase 1
VGITKELPTVISFCSGYGGIERGLDLAGLEHRVIAYVEIEAFAIANLVNKMEAGQLPPAPIYTNLKTFPAHLFRDRVDLITGGYPCQPFSAAGQRKGADDPRHLWPFIRRHIDSIRPLRCFFENVEGHISLGLSTVISDLEEDGYRTAWGIFSAREVGAPHQRKRVYILADSQSKFGKRGFAKRVGSGKSQKTIGGRGAFESVADTSGEGLQGSQWLGKARKEGISRGLTPECSDQLADTICSRSETGIPGQERYNKERDARVSINCGGEHGRWQIGMPWPPEPRLGRVVDGCADRVDRIRMLGNGVVPQTAAKAYLTLKVRGLK